MNRDGAASRDRTTPLSSVPPEENDEEVDLYSGIELQRSASVPKKSDARRQTTTKTHANGSNLASSVAGLAPDARLGVTRETATSGRAPEAASRLSSDDDADADHDESESSDDDDDVDIILGSSQPALGEQAAQFAASWNEVARDMQPSAERNGPAVGLGMISTEASLQSAAVLNSMLPEPTMKNIAPGRQKSLYEVELEQLDEKPWREPGAVLSDYFNYGFTEETWKIYCQHQAAMRQETTFLQRQVTGNVSTAARERDKGTRGTLAIAGGSGTNSSTLRDRQRRPGDEDKAKHEPKETTRGSEKHPGTSWKMAGSSASILPSKDVLERLAQVRNQIMSKAAPSQVKDSTTSGIGGRETTSARRSGAGTTRSVSERQPPSSSERERKRKRNHDDRPADAADAST
ncbi:pre-mRNA 3-end-processing factor fip1l1 [Cyanidiococcus yangmingshanensis]|uniref:Pre-mRNA 3-end-processing factor fip1l1 n=1 Tax=Cyanidiococcus yangmingshanensis TaxID=2690220 RepID=A0A7J7IPV1_9RHOD|nr:pre-mRNA 3-end-processing factor fip1l1 [Cyanidiococcus yangmingshanensis]